PVTERPPHRSVRAGLPHTAPTSADKPLMRPGMKNSVFREPVVCRLRRPAPREAVLLAAPAKAASPQTSHVIAKRAQCRAIGRHSVVGKESGDDLFQPSPCSGIG